MSKKQNNTLMYIAGGGIALYFLTKKKAPAQTDPMIEPAPMAQIKPTESITDNVINWFTGLW
jgi:hypothetical protein